MENKAVSIIIPTINEEENINTCIETARRLDPLEIIVVDAGSTDRTREIAINTGAMVIQSSKGRGIQMNKGASLARGDILLFLHADTLLPDCSQELLNVGKCYSELASESRLPNAEQEILKRAPHDILDKNIGGFFRLKFNENSISLRLVELFANLRARIFSIPYGDQAIFIRKDVFENIGGFREYPFLEDIDMSIRLKKVGRLKYLPLSVIVSARRIKKGYPFSPILASLRNVLIALLFMLGISPNRLLKFYK